MHIHIAELKGFASSLHVWRTCTHSTEDLQELTTFTMPHRTIHIFRKGLRLHDNPTLLAALESSDVIFPLYILDKNFITSNTNIGSNRWNFLLQSIEDLHCNLQKLNSCLFVIKGDYKQVLRDYVQKWNITQVTVDHEIEPYYRDMDENITAMGQELGFQFLSLVSHTLYDIRRIITENGGRAPLTYKRFLHILSRLGDPEPPSREITEEHFMKCTTPADAFVTEEHRVPLPEDLDVPRSKSTNWIGGESQGLRRLEQHLEKQGWVSQFKKPQTIPNSLLPSTTGLSPYFSVGCLSVRVFFQKLSTIYAQAKNHSLPPVSLQGQLLWREFFYTVASYTPNFTKMAGNPICLQIDWYKDEDKLNKWTKAQTGFPWIDAIMTQLREEGWIHHLARHAVACFLTRGDLWISWEEGMKVFEELLLDADYSINAGNWMWLSASAFFHHYTRIFCPVRFGKRTDPDGNYIRKYLPVLKDFPAKYIYDPWTAPEDIQKQAKCIIGQDYPFPMVDHKVVSEHNLQLMKLVREQQHKTADLTQDAADDPMELDIKECFRKDKEPNSMENPNKKRRCAEDMNVEKVKTHELCKVKVC
ncbi:cryptochrome-1-like [Engystomops pustulosus]|uniref:cryptochrome-1-like n=1 Tax=Engystomops pustulosus TaxID=76066 RepID=UPI003AFB4DCF